jgi:hypothetical protein
MSQRKFSGLLDDLSKILALKNQPYSNRYSYDDLVNAESELGRTVFGPVPAGHRREFFKTRDNVWIWFDEWNSEAGQPQNISIRYEVRPEGVFKKGSGGTYVKINGDELENFLRAARKYYELVKTKLYC